MSVITANFTMGKARALKHRADSFLEEVFRTAFEEIDTARIKREVDRLRAEKPGFEPRQHARILARRTSIRCAAAGAVTIVPGGFAALGALGADLAYLIYQQFRLILGIATVYGHEPSSRERFDEALQCLALASGVGVGKQGIAKVVEAVSIEGGMVAEKVGASLLRERLLRFIPIFGGVAGGALNYAAVQTTARSAIRYYESRIDPQEAEEIWADGDREHA